MLIFEGAVAFGLDLEVAMHSRNPVNLYLPRKCPQQIDLPLWRRWPMPRWGPWTRFHDPSMFVPLAVEQ